MTQKELLRIDYEKRVKELKILIDFFRACKRHVEHARQKHPQFAKRVLWREDDLYNRNEALFQKRRIEDGYSLEAILMSEVHEFLVEMHNGNLERAKEEAADVMAVLYRAIAGDINNA